jgi:serine/threonine protein kinase
MTFAPHTKLARYEIVSPIGADGMGEVYLAKDTRLNRKVALKVLPADVATNQERMRRFEQEACAASALSHPNIAHIYEIGESDGTNFIAMEFVEGATLRETIHGEQVDLKTLLKYLGQVADGLAKAHVARIVHRDLKPENIMISRDGFAKILDFGLAKLIDRQLPAPGEPNSEAATAMLPEPLSAPGMIMGTVGYMSPEQARGKKEIDGRSDIFSFGCILYEAATGRQPFAGETAIDSLHKIIYAQPPSIKDFNKNAPPDLQRIVRRCLRKDPEERYQTIKDVAIEIKELRREMKSEAKTELSIAPEKVATSNASKSENRTLIEDEKTAAATAGQVAHSTSSAEYLVSQIGQHKKAVAFVAIAALVAVAGLIFGLYKFYGSRQLSTAAAPLRVTPLTSFPSVERNPALSPDGKQVAYVWMGEKGDNYDIYVKITDAGTPLRLTTDPEREMSPAWSPDSRFVAFRRGRGEKKGFYIVPALGGAERKIADAYEWNQSGLQQQAVDWSPDGKTLAVVDKTSENEPWSIFLLLIETGEKRRLTTPPAQIRGDVLAAFSPDGKTLAFARTNALGGNIFLVPVAGGEPSQVTFNETSSLLGLDWTSDGERLVFSSETAGRLALWTISATGGTLRPSPGSVKMSLICLFPRKAIVWFTRKSLLT